MLFKVQLHALTISITMAFNPPFNLHSPMFFADFFPVADRKRRQKNKRKAPMSHTPTGRTAAILTTQSVLEKSPSTEDLILDDMDTSPARDDVTSRLSDLSAGSSHSGSESSDSELLGDDADMNDIIQQVVSSERVLRVREKLEKEAEVSGDELDDDDDDDDAGVDVMDDSFDDSDLDPEFDPVKEMKAERS